MERIWESAVDNVAANNPAMTTPAMNPGSNCLAMVGSASSPSKDPTSGIKYRDASPTEMARNENIAYHVT